jgi:uncharacterized RDD family membrane protein YckC
MRIKLLLWILLVQLLLNPFTVFVVVGLISGISSFMAFLVFFGLMYIYANLWYSIRLRYKQLDTEAMKIWIIN